MLKFRLGAVFLAFLLAAALPCGGFAQTQDTYTVQNITTIAGSPYSMSFLQGISGYTLGGYTDAGKITLNFNNASVSGIYNVSYGLGSFRNLGSLAYVNIQPDLAVSPVQFVGQMLSQNNRVTINDYNYAINMNLSGFTASGLVVLNAMAGSFSNQFTSLTFNMGRGAAPSTSPGIFSVTNGNPNIVSLSNQQMQLIAATGNNDFKVLGNKNAEASIQGTPNIQGVCAMTLSAGVNNMVNHHVEVNFDTSR